MYKVRSKGAVCGARNRIIQSDCVHTMIDARMIAVRLEHGRILRDGGNKVL